MNPMIRAGLLATSLLAATATAAFADVYDTANFTIGVFGGNANQSAPFQGVVASYPAGSSYSGGLVFDQNLVPGATSGYQNVFFSSFPAIAQIPSATALSFTLGGLPTFTLADAATPPYGTQEAAIQYNNGVFAGLFYISDFTYLGNPYELQIQGGSFDIVPIVDGEPTFTSLVNGYVDYGVTNVQPYTPPSGTPVDEPGSLGLLLAGLAGLAGIAFACRRLHA
jgi:hypothetical protein